MFLQVVNGAAAGNPPGIKPIILTVSTSLFVSLCGGNINWILQTNPVFFSSISVLLVIAFLFGALLSCWFARRLGIQDNHGPHIFHDPPVLPGVLAQRWQRISIYLIVGVIGLIISTLILGPLLFPPFEITDPVQKQTVEPVQMVSGHGGIYNSKVQVFVTAPDSQVYPQSVSAVAQNGVWNVPNVYFGEPNDSGAEFRVVACYFDELGQPHHSREVVVIRK